MPFKKCNPKEELNKRCSEDKDIKKYAKEFDEEYEKKANLINSLSKNNR